MPLETAQDAQLSSERIGNEDRAGAAERRQAWQFRHGLRWYARVRSGAPRQRLEGQQGLGSQRSVRASTGVSW